MMKKGIVLISLIILPLLFLSLKNEVVLKRVDVSGDRIEHKIKNYTFQFLQPASYSHIEKFDVDSNEWIFLHKAGWRCGNAPIERRRILPLESRSVNGYFSISKTSNLELGKYRYVIAYTFDKNDYKQPSKEREWEFVYDEFRVNNKGIVI